MMATASLSERGTYLLPLSKVCLQRSYACEIFWQGQQLGHLPDSRFLGLNGR
jgi:hypothetical protein